jgi:hypothetical protein
MSTNYIEKALRIRSSDMVGYWPLDDERGTVALDVSPNGYNGTSSGLVRVPETRGFPGPDGGKCAQFDGSASYIDLVGAAPASATTEGTISAWVATPTPQLSGTTKMQVVLAAADTANAIGIDFDTTAYRFSADYFAGAGDATYSTTTGKLIYNVDGGLQKPEWQHLAMTYSATDDALILYVNGTASTTAASLGTFTGSFASTAMVLGSTSTTIATAFTGWMSNVGWWSTPMTQAEITELSKIGP